MGWNISDSVIKDFCITRGWKCDEQRLAQAKEELLLYVKNAVPVKEQGKTVQLYHNKQYPAFQFLVNRDTASGDTEILKVLLMPKSSNAVQDEILAVIGVGTFFFLVGLLFAIFYSFSLGEDSAWTIFGSVMAISGASSLIGSLIGLIFGVPKAPDVPENNHDANGSVKQYQPNKYQPNNNFELISDWLTKIIVGVGLIEIKELPDAIYDLSLTLKPVLGNQL